MKYVLIALLSLGLVACDEQPRPEVTLIIKDHVFQPSTLEVPAGQKLALVVKNQDATAEEFESDDLRREKVVPANSEVRINIGPLKPGTYHFMGEFNQATAKGQILAK